jgi:hypothetical protein
MGTSSLKKVIKSNDKLADIVRYLIIPITISKILYFNLGAVLRKYKLTHCLNNYALLKQFNGIHKNKRCFIVATGPSLRIEDLEKIKDEITFSMNSIYLSYSKTKWRPTYYGIQDPLVYEKIQHKIINDDFQAAFIGSNVAKAFNLKPHKNRFIFPLDLLNHQMPNSTFNSKFSDNIYERIYSGYNIAYTMLQIAVYMGIKEIYLLGADCDYQQPKKYFEEDKNRGKEKYFTKKFLATNTEKFIAAYQVAKIYAEKNNIKIYNATRGGKLEVFERVDFDSLFY